MRGRWKWFEGDGWIWTSPNDDYRGTGYDQTIQRDESVLLFDGSGKEIPVRKERRVGFRDDSEK